MRRFSPHHMSAWPALLRYDRLTVVVKRWWVLAPLLLVTGALLLNLGLVGRPTVAWLVAGVLLLAALLPARSSEARVRRWLIDRHGLLDETLLQPVGPLDPDGRQHLKLVTEARDRNVDARTYLPRPPAAVAAFIAPWLAVVAVLWLPVGAVPGPSPVPDTAEASGPPPPSEAVSPAAESSQTRAMPEPQAEPQAEPQPESAAKPPPEPASTSPDGISPGADEDAQATAPQRESAPAEAARQPQENDPQTAGSKPSGSEPSGPEASGLDMSESDRSASQRPPPPDEDPRTADRDANARDTTSQDAISQPDDRPADANATQSAEASGEPTNPDPNTGLNGAEGGDADSSTSGSPQADAPNVSEPQTAPSSTPSGNENQGYEARPAQPEGQAGTPSEDSATSAPQAPAGDDTSQRQNDGSRVTRDEDVPETAGSSSSEPRGTATERSQDAQTPVRTVRDRDGDDVQGTATPPDSAAPESAASDPVASDRVASESAADGRTSSEERRQPDVQDNANPNRAADRTQRDTPDRAANPAPTQDLAEEQATPVPTTGTTTGPADTLPAPKRAPQSRVVDGGNETPDRASSTGLEGSPQPSNEDSLSPPAGRDRDVSAVPPTGDAPVLPQDRETVERYFTDDAAP